MRCAWLVAVAALALAGAALADDPAWLTEFDRLMGAGDAPGAEAYLLGRPLEEQKTADYMWALGRVHRALNRPEAAALDLVTYDILTRRKGRDVADLRAWLAAQGRLFLAQAEAALKRGDRTAAVRSYLHAALCDQSLLKRPDGLRDATGFTLAKIVHDRPDRNDYWMLLAGYHFHLSHLDASRAAMLHYLKGELSPFLRWRGEVMLSSIDRGLEKHRQLADKLMRQAEADAAAAPAEPAPPEPPPPPPAPKADEELERRLEKQRRLIDLDGRIRDLENRIAELRRIRKGEVHVGSHGQVFVTAHNQRQVKADLAAAEKQLEDLKYERDNL